MRITSTSFVLALVAGCATAPRRLGVDHVILGVSDLDAGIAAFEAATGVRAARGGTHAGGGTHDALVSLGDHTYLELLAPDGTGTPDPELARLASPAPVGFALAAPDVAAVRAEVERAGLATTTPEPGGRTLPGGAELHWTTFGLADASLGDAAPFFIHWDDAATHPARTSPRGCTLTSVDLTVPDPAVLTRLRLAREVRVHAGPPAIVVTLACGARDVRFATPR
jgi:hypothetical protein